MMTESQNYDNAHKAVMARKNNKANTNKPVDAPASSNDNASASTPATPAPGGSSTTDANANANADGRSDKELEADADNAKKAFEEARANVLKQQQAYTAKASAQLRLKLANQASDALQATKNQVQTQITDIENKLTALKTELDNSLNRNILADDPVAKLVPPDPKSVTKGDRSSSDDLANYWTRIACEVESSYKATQESMESSSYSVGGAASWGLFNIGGSYSHSDATSKAASQMSNLSCSISFDVMRVDITRPWLQTTVFYDSRLDAAPTAKISPGPSFLRMLMEKADDIPSDVTLLPKDKTAALREYNLFSHFSTGMHCSACGRNMTEVYAAIRFPLGCQCSS
ncbi:hypothetical protein CPB86DRAFT_46472 [Serendipita vermifera]|nr:hypothetical protein CPB86DRAFT_46472 [Serendipita vermifera]